MWRIPPSLFVVSIALACVSIAPQVKKGDAPPPKRVVLLPPSCASIEGACEEEYGEGVAGIVQSELDFAGITVVDGRQLVADIRSRDEAAGSIELLDVEVISAKGTAQSGSLFEDLSPARKRALLDEARADGVVSVKIVVGPRDGLGPVRHNEVQVRLSRGDGDDLVWSTRCAAKSGFNPPVSQSLAKAARCALSGVLDDVRDVNLTESAL